MLRWLRRNVGYARLVALLLVAFAIFLRIADPIPSQVIRNQTFDLFHRIKPREAQPLPVAIIDVDDRSITEIGQWPWPRTRFAEIVETATRAGAVAIAFDIVFAEPDRLSPPVIARDNPDLPPALRGALSALPGNDAILARAFAEATVIVGQTSVRSAFAEAPAARVIPEVPHALVGPDPTPFLIAFPDLVENLPELEAAAAGRGVFNVRPDADGVYRRAPVVMLVDGRLRLGLAPELLRVATGGAPFAIRTNEAGIDGVVLAGRLLPTAGDGTVHPYLAPTDRARFVSAADLLSGRMPPGRLAGHLVLVGTSAIGLEDYRATPLGIQMAGVEIHAQMLENFLSDTLLVRPNYAIGAELVAMLAMCLVIIVLTPIMNAILLVASALMFLSSFGLASYALFENQRLLIDPSFPILSGLATVIFMSTTNYLREERRRMRIRAAFGQYVSQDLVNELSENQDRLRLGGENRELTLLFSDVHGFTEIAESYREDPAGLTRLMNRFLSLLSNAILAQRGTIDKFIGDAVMAFWNAPLDHDDHCRAACRAALRMIADVAALNDERRADADREGRVFQPIHVGIGINTGICTVGNMGSDRRFDYTAMGDPVNLASRLEGQSRSYGTAIIVGSATERAVRGDFALLELDLIRVKGKRQPERVFALLGDAALRAAPQFVEAAAISARMLDAYRAMDWDDAEAELAALEPVATGIDPALARHFAALRKRIAGFRAQPPDAGWDGVHDATEK